MPTITYNASTGSDTQASGAGGTAVFGSAASSTASSATISLGGTFNLSAFSAGDVAYFGGNSGDRHLFTIASFTGGAATCTALVMNETATSTTSSQNWAVGGLRQTPQNDTSNADVEDAAAGWEFAYESGDYTYTVGNVALTVVGTQADGGIRMIAAPGATTMPRILCTDTGFVPMFLCQTAGQCVFVRGLYFQKTGGNWQGARAFNFLSQGEFTAIGCEWNGDNGSGSNQGSFLNTTASSTTRVIDCYMHGGYEGILMNSRNQAFIHGCRISNSAISGITLQGNTSLHGCHISSCVFDGNGVDGIHVDQMPGGRTLSIVNNVFHNNTGDGISFEDATPGNEESCIVINNIFTDNGGYGITAAGAYSIDIVYTSHNAFRNNTSGARNNVETDGSDVTLTADPYTNAAAGDYTLNTTAGGGAACTDAGTGYNG